MTHKNNESGRSMLEMIAVLIIIGLLTAGGLVGYSYLVQRYRRQESVKEVAELVLGIKTAALARRHEDGVTIGAREVLQGPKMNPSGEVLLLPEGENSYAVVTNLTGGAFAINLQLEKGTCQALLEALKNEDITMFEPSDKPVREGTIADVAEDWAQGTKTKGLLGVKYNVKETEEDKKLVDSSKGAALRKKIMEACQGDNDKLGRAAWVFDCSKGSSSYGWLYDLFCSGCPVGSMRDATGKCCSYSSKERCGNLCSCPEGTMCDPEKNQCVECATVPTQEIGNAQCKNIYNLFAKHVCNKDTNRCVECVDNEDCQNTHGFKDSGDYESGYSYCYDFKCVNCNMNYDGTPVSAGHYPCQDKAKPLCHQGLCEPCPDSSIWNDEKKTCSLCYDSATGTTPDEGCKTDPKAPICLTKPVVRNDGTKTDGDSCVQCLLDEHCPAETPVCDITTHMCETCAQKDPDTPVWDNKSKTCKACQDTQSGLAVDTGCNRPKWRGMPICLTNPPKNEKSQLAGDSCVECLTDENCSGEKPVCSANYVCVTCAEKDPNKPLWNSAKKTCEVCRDTETTNTVDAGCDAARWAGKPICLTDPVKNEKSGLFGEDCVECVANADCPEDRPSCDTTTHTCKACSGTTPVWDNASQQCVACKDTATGKGQDAGCGPENWRDKNICAAGENTGNGNVGSSCGACMDDQTGTTTDSGCGEGTFAGKPICVVAGNKNESSKLTGDSCVECFVNSDCKDSAKPFCETTNGAYRCVSCTEASQTRGHNPLRPYYVNANGQDGCYVCIDDKTGVTTDSGCGGNGTWKNKPICDSGTNNGQGKGANSCKTGCTGCLDKDGKCLTLSDYEDLEKDADGKCKCKTLNKKFDFPKQHRSVSSDYSDSYNYKYSHVNSSFLKLRSTASGSLKKMYCEHTANFSISADDCIYATFLGAGNCEACFDKCLGNKENCLHHKANYMCSYNTTVKIPAGSGPYNSIWAEASDIHKTSCSLSGSVTIK